MPSTAARSPSAVRSSLPSTTVLAPRALLRSWTSTAVVPPRALLRPWTSTAVGSSCALLLPWTSTSMRSPHGVRPRLPTGPVMRGPTMRRSLPPTAVRPSRMSAPAMRPA
jgi:hypothetical protein